MKLKQLSISFVLSLVIFFGLSTTCLANEIKIKENNLNVISTTETQIINTPIKNTGKSMDLDGSDIFSVIMFMIFGTPLTIGGIVVYNMKMLKDSNKAVNANASLKKENIEYIHATETFVSTNTVYTSKK